jgi:hypothetical protein
MAIYRTIKYASMHREANFYAIVYNGRTSAYEVSGKDLGVSGFKRVTYVEFNRLMEETKKQDNVVTMKVNEKKVKAEVKTEAKRLKTEMAKAQRKINKQVNKNTYKMAASEWAWDYLPTL